MNKSASLTVAIEAAPAYEFILTLCAATDVEGQAGYEIGRAWFDAVRADAGPDVWHDAASLCGGSDKVWAHLLSLAYEAPTPRDVPALLTHLDAVDALELRLRLLGYYVRYLRRATPPEVIAAAAMGDPAARRRFQRTSYAADAAWQAALRELLPLDATTTKHRVLTILRVWYERVFQPREAEIMPIVRRDAEERLSLLHTLPPERVVETVTRGWEYVPEPGIRHLLLIPSYVLRPQVHSLDHHEVKIICYAVADESLDSSGDAPPARLPRLAKALGDERRLRLLKRLTTGEYTLQELADYFGAGNTTMLHHLIILRAAGLVRLRGGTSKRYSLRRETLPEVGELLDSYLKE